MTKDPKLAAVADAMEKGDTEAQTKALADLSSDMQGMNAFLGKAQWQLTPDQIASAMPDVGKALEDTGLKQLAKNANDPGSIYTHDIHAEDTAAKALDTATESGSTLGDIYNALRLRGIKLDKPFLENEMKGVIRDAVFDAASEALTDYYVLQHMDADEALKAIKDGGDPKSLAKSFTSELSGGKRDITGGQVSALHPNAQGGVVSAVRDGMAIVRPGAGEGIMTARPGERIGGGGGGPQVVHVMFKGDAGKILETHVDNRIAYNKTKQMTR